MTYKFEYYQIPTGIDADMAAHIKKTIHNYSSERETSSIGGNDVSVDLETRNSTSRWIAVDNFIAGIMAHCVLEANRNFFQFDLTQWSEQIQYTEYNGKGTHYAWHYDSSLAGISPLMVRKLSISLSLSDPSDYEGGEFQLLDSSAKHMHTFKAELGQAIIFPSYLLHRVRPLRSGNRVSLVGWYGGPPFR